MTASESIIARATLTAEVKDVDDRMIKIRKLTAFDRMRLAELIGADNVNNSVYFSYALAAYHVVGINGERIPSPQSKAEIEAIVKRLGDDGLIAVGNGIEQNMSEKARSEDEAQAEIKN